MKNDGFHDLVADRRSRIQSHRFLKDHGDVVPFYSPSFSFNSEAFPSKDFPLTTLPGGMGMVEGG
jgi:hypothetical protein